MAVCCDLEVDVNGQWLRDFHGDEPNEEEIVHAQPKTKQRKKLFGQRKQVLLTSRQLQKQEAAEPVIIGGMVLDIHATPSIPANLRTTTPSKVNYVLGGVASNVAECMSKLGAKPYMISALGLDIAGDFAFYFVVS
ncbi:hypothetical protein AB3S75_037145 [Citrus x aurantiifolia]